MQLTNILSVVVAVAAAAIAAAAAAAPTPECYPNCPPHAPSQPWTGARQALGAASPQHGPSSSKVEKTLLRFVVQDLQNKMKHGADPHSPDALLPEEEEEEAEEAGGYGHGLALPAAPPQHGPSSSKSEKAPAEGTYPYSPDATPEAPAEGTQSGGGGGEESDEAGCTTNADCPNSSYCMTYKTPPYVCHA